MEWFEALVLGLVQGLTEFLPVSSSGHLLITKELFGLQTQDVSFEVVVHAATLLATLVAFWPFLWDLLRHLCAWKRNAQTRYVCLLLLSTLPVLVVGLFFKDAVEALFVNGCLGLSPLGVVGAALLLTATLLGLSQYVSHRHAARPPKPLNGPRALGIGTAQAFALIPGLSRSGTTLATGLLLGLPKEEVARFSFLMVLIPVGGEALLSLCGGDLAASHTGIPVSSLVIGFCAAFASGLVACKWMLRLVAKARLGWFALYCLAVGLACLFVHFK